MRSLSKEGVHHGWLMGWVESSWNFNSPSFRLSQNIFALDIIDEITLP